MVSNTVGSAITVAYHGVLIASTDLIDVLKYRCVRKLKITARHYRASLLEGAGGGQHGSGSCDMCKMQVGNVIRSVSV